MLYFAAASASFPTAVAVAFRVLATATFCSICDFSIFFDFLCAGLRCPSYHCAAKSSRCACAACPHTQEGVYGWDIRLGAISRNLPQSPAISRDLKWSRGLGEVGLAVLAHLASRNPLGTQ